MPTPPPPASGQVDSHPCPLRTPPYCPGQHARLSHACSCDAPSVGQDRAGQGAVGSSGQSGARPDGGGGREEEAVFLPPPCSSPEWAASQPTRFSDGIWASDAPSLVVDKQSSRLLGTCPGQAHGGRQESPCCSPHTAQGLRTQLNRGWTLATGVALPHWVLSLQGPRVRSPLTLVGATRCLPEYQARWVSLACAQATPEVGHQPGRRCAGPRPQGPLCHEAAVR